MNSHLTHAFAPQAAAIQRFLVFSDLSNTDCTTIISAARQKLFLKKRIVFFAGDPIEQVVFLLSGSAKITQFGHTGTEVILRVNRMGDVLGGFGATVKDRHCCTAETLDDCRALVWESATFQILADRFPVVRRNVLRILEERLRDLDERFREVSTENVASRLSRQLLRLANQFGKQEAEGAQVNLSQQELARMTGTTLFTVSRLLSQWEKEGTVSTRREVVFDTQHSSAGRDFYERRIGDSLVSVEKQTGGFAVELQIFATNPRKISSPNSQLAKASSYRHGSLQFSSSFVL